MCVEEGSVCLVILCVYATMHACLCVGRLWVSMHVYVCVVYIATERSLQKLHKACNKTRKHKSHPVYIVM